MSRRRTPRGPVPARSRADRTPTCAVPGCDRPVGDQAYVCQQSTYELRTALERLQVDERARPGGRLDYAGTLVEDLLLTHTGQARHASALQGGGRGDRAPYRAVDAAGRLHATMCQAIARLADWSVAQLPFGPQLPHDMPPSPDPSGQATWLLRHLETLRHWPEAGALVLSVIVTVRRALDLIDSRAGWYAGPCGTPTGPEAWCGRDLYAEPGASFVTCRKCGADYDVQVRREWMLTAADDQLAHAELLGRALSALGVDTSPSAIRGFAHRNRLPAHGHDQAGRPLYRVGEVRALVDAAAARRKKTAA